MDHLLKFVSAHYWMAAGTAIALALVVVYEMRARTESQFSVSPQELIRLMNQGALVLDLRPQDKFAEGHLAGARQMSGEALLAAGDTLKKHKEKTVVVYDDTGTLSGPAIRQLAAQGFTRAYTLRGGLSAWRADNLPVSRA
jgi:rhodanese-related sulfurtransferase